MRPIEIECPYPTPPLRRAWINYKISPRIGKGGRITREQFRQILAEYRERRDDVLVALRKFPSEILFILRATYDAL